MNSHDEKRFEEWLSSFHSLAFRLELRSEYLVECEADLLSEYLSGRPLAPPLTKEYAEWDELQRSSQLAGKAFQRIHVLPRKLSPYLRFEIEWAYCRFWESGEDIRLAFFDEAAAVLNGWERDFWMFDEKVVYFVNYDHEGRFQGTDCCSETQTLTDCVNLRRQLLAVSLPLPSYLANVRSE